MKDYSFFQPYAKNVCFSEHDMVIYLCDGRTLSVPLAFFPSLFSATKSQLENYRLIGMGEGIHWADLDEDISIKAILGT